MTLPISAARLATLLGGHPLERPAYRSLAAAIRRLIADGRLPHGSRLPGERSLAPALGVSRTTVTHAYAVLRDQGRLTARVGAGWEVTLPASLTRPTRGGLFPVDTGPGVIDLTCAATRASAGVAEAYEAALERLPELLAGSGYLVMGLPELREVIAARYSARGVATSADQIIITSGAVAGIQVVAAALLRPGDRVVTETPTYPNSLEVLRRSAARVAGAPMLPDGWDLDALVGLSRGQRAALALLIPDFHNPTGLLMTDEQRAECAGRLRGLGVRTVVDETIAEVALDPLPDPPLPYAAHDPRAVSVGSASKSHWGGLRIGWIRAPRELVAPLVSSRVSIDLGAPVLEQVVLTTLLTEHPRMADHRRAALRATRDTLVAGVHEHAPSLTFRTPTGGLSLWLELTSPDAVAVAEEAEHEGLLLAPGPRFAVAGGFERWLRLPYVLAPDEMGEAATRLGRALHRVAQQPSGQVRAGAGHQEQRPLIA